MPCLRTDDLVFHLDKPEVRARWEKATGMGLGSSAELHAGIGKLFLSDFTRKGAKACAISLPPDLGAGARLGVGAERRAGAGARFRRGSTHSCLRHLLGTGRALPRLRASL